MPNPVAVNDLSPISGSLQTSRISYAVETAGKDYGQDYNSTTWYSDIPQNGSQYTIITDNYTANYYVSRSNAEGAYVEGGLPAVDEYSAPVFWLTAGTSSLDIITIVNGLPDRRGQIPFNSGSQALNWVASSSNYFAVGPPYEQIDADNLRLYLDANQVISYPTTQSTWYDLSGYNQNFTLYNGLQTSWNTNGWFTFDQTDDYALNTTSQFQSSSGTIIVTCYPNSGLDNDYIAGVGGDFTIGGSRAIGVITNVWWLVSYGGGVQDFVTSFPVNYNRWSQVAYIWNNTTSVTASVNGQFQSTTKTLVTPSGTNFTLGRPPWNDASLTWGGNLAKVQFYPKALTQAEMLQNYYGGPIVTGSISGSYYANNLVSYVTGSTNTYNLSANIISGSLQNGVGFSPLNGGYWSFDGTDDQILLEGSTTNAWNLPTSIDWTVNAWIRTTTTANGLGQGSIFSNSNGGPVYSMMGINAGVITYWYYLSSWVKSSGTIPVNDGKWHMLTWVNFAGGTMNLYVDGGIDTAGVGSNTSTNNALDIIGASFAGYFQGDIASLQINKGKAFTAAEVLQQYNATK
jgi:hypothetical protein